MSYHPGNPDLLKEFQDVEFIWQIQKAILEKYSNIKIAFIVFDTNNDQYIFPDELSERLVQKGISDETNRHIVFFNFMDDDEDGRISFTDWSFGFKKIGRKIHETRNRLVQAGRNQPNTSYVSADQYPTRDHQAHEALLSHETTSAREANPITPNKPRRDNAIEAIIERYAKHSPTRVSHPQSPSASVMMRMSPLVGGRQSPPHSEDMVKHMTHVPSDMASYSYSPIKSQRSPQRNNRFLSPEQMSFGSPPFHGYNFMPTSNEKLQQSVHQLYQGQSQGPMRRSPITSPIRYNSLQNGQDARIPSYNEQGLGHSHVEQPTREYQHAPQWGSPVQPDNYDTELPKIRGAEFGVPELSAHNAENTYVRSSNYQSPPTIKDRYAEDPYIREPNTREPYTRAAVGAASRGYTSNPASQRKEQQAVPLRELSPTENIKIDSRKDSKEESVKHKFVEEESSSHSKYSTPEKYSETQLKSHVEPTEPQAQINTIPRSEQVQPTVTQLVMSYEIPQRFDSFGTIETDINTQRADFIKENAREAAPSMEPRPKIQTQAAVHHETQTVMPFAYSKTHHDVDSTKGPRKTSDEQPQRDSQSMPLIKEEDRENEITTQQTATSHFPAPAERRSRADSGSGAKPSVHVEPLVVSVKAEPRSSVPTNRGSPAGTGMSWLKSPIPNFHQEDSGQASSLLGLMAGQRSMSPLELGVEDESPQKRGSYRQGTVNLPNFIPPFEAEQQERPQSLNYKFLVKMSKTTSKGLRPHVKEEGKAEDQTQWWQKLMQESRIVDTEEAEADLGRSTHRSYISDRDRSSIRDRSTISERGRLSHRSDKSERRSAGASLNPEEIQKPKSARKSVSERILTEDDLFSRPKTEEADSTLNISTASAKRKRSVSFEKSILKSPKFERFTIREEHTNEEGSPVSQNKRDLRKMSQDVRNTSRSFDTDLAENNDRSLIYGKESPIKSGFTFSRQEKIVKEPVMSIRELKHQLGDTQSKALRNFSGFLDTLSTFDLKTDKKKIPKKDTVRIARSTLSNFLLENPNQSRILTEKEKEETHPSTASYLDFSGSSKVYLINEFTRLQVISKQLSNASHTLKTFYPTVSLPSDRSTKKTFLKR